MKLKGTMVLELTDEATREVERITEENMVTEAVNDILGMNPMGVFYSEEDLADVLSWNGTLLPICPNMVGGILLFPQTLEEDAAHIYEMSGNLPVAYASNNVNTTANTARGSLNQTESKALENGYKFVWEFTPSQGNGTIAAVALTSAQGGQNAYGSLVGDASTFLKIKKLDIGDLGKAKQAVLFEAAEVDFGNDLLYSITFADSSVRIRKVRIPIFTIGLNEKLDDSTYAVLEDHAVQTETFLFLGSYTKYGEFLDGQDGYWYGFSNEGNSSGNAKMLWVKISKADYSIYEAAVGLFAMLCKKYSLDPLADGVVISHKEGHSRGIASNHGDPEHLWAQLDMGYTMDGFRKAVNAAMGGAASGGSGTDGYTKIMGSAVATAEQMKNYIKAKNPKVAQSVLDMVPLYLSEGGMEGVRGDIAFAQSCLETGNFTFSGSVVTLSQNNFCGMGVTSNGVKGNSFDTPQLGIRTQVQHLKAYAARSALKNDCIDPRFKYVTRGCAEYAEWLGQKENPDGKGWAAGAGYGEKILAILKGILGMAGGVSSGSVGDEGWYRVRKSWADASSQKGAFKSLENAKKCADDNLGHSVFDESGKAVYTGAAAFVPYMVRVSIPDLNIRKAPGTDKPKTGKVASVGVFTIVEEADGRGASRWGLLKSYQEKRDGWISLDYTIRV